MKWPLKYQVMLPMTVIMLCVVMALTILHAYLAAQQTARHITGRIQDVTRTLSKSSFPTTDAVLAQMQGLAGADFVLVDQHGNIVASTRDLGRSSPLTELSPAFGPTPMQLATPVRIADESFFHAAVSIAPRSPSAGPLLLHVLYPEQAYLRERRQAILPPLVIGAIALAVVVGLAVFIAARVTQPLGRLRAQVSQIAQGDFRPLTLPALDDEVRELAMAVNQMAGTLAAYEAKIRHTEQIRVLAQLGGGLAHQLRNAVTGARMAVDLHQADCPQGQHDESLAVATRQLILMEKYVQRFLALGTTPQTPRQPWDFSQLVAHLVPLVQPAAQHAAVQLTVQSSEEPRWILGDRDALEHMVLNVLLNAVEAASYIPAASDPREAEVHIAVSSPRPTHVTLTVTDTGPGPAPAVADRLFEPFVTTKRDGTGLGLAVAKEVAEQHGGTVSWSRQGGRTIFLIELPLVNKGSDCGETAGRG